VGAFVRFLVLWLAACWTVVGLLLAPVLPGGWAGVALLAAATTAPLAALVASRRGGRAPGKAFRLLVLRPFWYAQLLLPLAAAAPRHQQAGDRQGGHEHEQRDRRGATRQHRPEQRADDGPAADQPEEEEAHEGARRAASRGSCGSGRHGWKLTRAPHASPSHPRLTSGARMPPRSNKTSATKSGAAKKSTTKSAARSTAGASAKKAAAKDGGDREDRDAVQRHRWVVDVIEEDSAAVEVDGRSVTPVPRWMLPVGARQGDVLAVSHRREDVRSVLTIEIDRAATDAAYSTSAAQVATGKAASARRDPGGDVAL
jgi:hypothetical protein